MHFFLYRSKWLFHNGKVYNEFCLSKEQRQQIVAEQALAGGVAGGLAASVRFKTDPFYELLEYVVPPKLLPGKRLLSFLGPIFSFLLQINLFISCSIGLPSKLDCFEFLF